jgi:hypothetical protein
MHVLTSHPPLYFVKRGCKAVTYLFFPLFAEQRGGKEGGEYRLFGRVKKGIKVLRCKRAKV